MPVRDRTGEQLTRDVVGIQVFNGLVGVCVTMPNDAYDDVRAAVDALYERFVDAIDWNRIRIEAESRHISLGPAHHRDTHREAEDVCGDCIREALLVGDGDPQRWPGGWKDAPTVARTENPPDWAAVVAASVGYRRTKT